MSSPNPQFRWLEVNPSAGTVRWAMRISALALATAETIVVRHAADGDTLSYLDIARACLRHDWTMTVNAYWQPLYTWLLAATLGLARPSPRWEIPAAHVLNLVLFAGCLWAFEYFWTRVLNLHHGTPATGDPAFLPLPHWVMWILGYVIFIWSTVGNVLPHLKPDLLLMIVVLVQAGLFVQILNREAAPIIYSTFGLALGLGYLTKAILFPISFIWLTLLLVARHSKGQRLRFALAVAVFLIVAMPEIVLVSRAKGRPTFADTGKLAYAWVTDDISYRHWQGEPPGTGTPLHPTRRLSLHPPAFEFNGPLRATYPPWFDPSYWEDGISPRFNLARLSRNAFRNAIAILRTFAKPMIWLAGLLILLLAADIRSSLRGFGKAWHLWAVGAAALTMYCLTFVEYRYLPVWELLLWAGLLTQIKLRKAWTRFPLSQAVSIVICLGSFAGLTSGIVWQFRHGAIDDVQTDYRIAEGLRALNVEGGEKVATIGFGYKVMWGYLDRLSVVAEIEPPGACEFWSASPKVQLEIMQKFQQSGAEFVVANSGRSLNSNSTLARNQAFAQIASCMRPGPGWHPIPGSLDYIFFLRRQN